MKTETFLQKYLGDKAFIKAYWKVAIPAFLWAIFVSLGPICATAFITSVIPNGTFGVNNQTLNDIFNYNIYAFGYVNILSVTFVLAGFSMIGNLIAKNDLAKLNEIMKDILWISMLCSIIVAIFMTVFSQGFEENIMGFYGPGSQYYSTFMSWAAISTIFYMLDWYFISSFGCLGLIWVQCWSAIIGFIFYIIVIGAYSASVVKGDNLNDISRNYAIVYDFWNIIQVIFIFGYCYFPTIYKLVRIDGKLQIQKVPNIAYQYFYFLRKWKFSVDWKLLGFYFVYSYWVMLDVVIWAVSDILSQVGSLRYPHAATGGNINSEMVYHVILLLCTQYSTYLYVFFNGFGLITNVFLSVPLGRGEIKNAGENTRRMFWWGFVIAFVLLAIVLVLSYELNMYLIGGTKNPGAYWQYKNEGLWVTTKYTYRDLWNMGMGMSCIYGGYMFINIMFNNIYYFELSGNSRFIVWTDAFISVVYAIVIWSLMLTNNNLDNFFSWYALGKSYVLWKLALGLIVVGYRKSLNSVDAPNWILFNWRKKVIADIEHSKKENKIRKEA